MDASTQASNADDMLALQNKQSAEEKKNINSKLD